MGPSLRGNTLESAATCHSNAPKSGAKGDSCVVQERINIGETQNLRQQHQPQANALTHERLRRAKQDRYARARLPGLHNLYE